MLKVVLGCQAVEEFAACLGDMQVVRRLLIDLRSPILNKSVADQPANIILHGGPSGQAEAD